MRIHVVQKGDTLWNIAQKYGVDFEQLKKMNSQLADPDKIMPGMKIKIPTQGKAVKKEQQVKPKEQQMKKPKEEQVQKPKAEHPYKDMSPKPMPVIKEDHQKKEKPVIEKPMMPMFEQNFHAQLTVPNMPYMQPMQEQPMMEEEPSIEEPPVPPVQQPIHQPIHQPCYPPVHHSMVCSYCGTPYPQAVAPYSQPPAYPAATPGLWGGEWESVSSESDFMGAIGGDCGCGPQHPVHPMQQGFQQGFQQGYPNGYYAPPQGYPAAPQQMAPSPYGYQPSPFPQMGGYPPNATGYGMNPWSGNPAGEGYPRPNPYMADDESE